jgi:hypothetical protein
MKPLLLLLLSALAAVPLAKAADEPQSAAMRRSIYTLRVTAQRFDSLQPWKKGTPERRTGYALAVGTNLLVTTEQLVRDAALVEVSPAGSARFYRASLLRADRDLNLALLDISRSDLPERPVPFELAAIPFPGSKGRFFQFEEGGILQEGGVQILRASMEPPGEGLPALLTLQFLSDIPLNGQALPILQENRLAGMAVSYDRSSKLGMLYPARTLKRFIEDAPLPSYQGLPVAGITWKPLPDPAKRRYLKAPEGDRGVQVVDTATGTDAANVFQPGDVLIAWSGYSVDQQGYYDDPALGRIPFSALISSCRPGDSVPVTIHRNGSETQAVVKLTARGVMPRRVPEYDNTQPPYLIEGGLVMRDLSGDYLRTAGFDWVMRANPRLVHLYITKGDEASPNGERIPLLAFVLPDTINVGYQHLRDEVITAVNGEPVQGLKDILRIRERDGVISRIRLQEMDTDLVLDAKTIPEANARIGESYRISNMLVPPG